MPELTQEMIERGDLYHGGRLIRRGRPKSADPKQQITLRLDAAVLRWFQESGPGYQSRIGAALKSHMTRKKSAAKASRGKAVNKKKPGEPDRLKRPVQPIQQIDPTGKSPQTPSSPLRKNILIFRNDKSVYVLACPVPLRATVLK